MNEPARLALADPSSADPAASGPVRFVVANGLRFAYLERGRGPLVLLLHGFPDNAETYVDLMEDLAAAGYRAVAPYLRGYAPTEIPEDGAFDPRTLAQDVAGLIGALEPGGRAHLVGMDWGGTSIQAAVVHCPELIASAVIMNAAHPATLGRFATDPDQVRQVFHFWFFQTDVAAQALAAGDLAMVSYLWRLWSPDHDPGPHLDSVRATLEAPGVLPAALAYYGALYEAAQERTFPLGPGAGADALGVRSVRSDGEARRAGGPLLPGALPPGRARGGGPLAAPRAPGRGVRARARVVRCPPPWRSVMRQLVFTGAR